MIPLVWQVSLLIVLKGVQVSTPLLKALVKVPERVKGVTPLSLPPPPPPTPFAPGSPYDARPGIQRFRGTPTAPSLFPSLSLSPCLSLRDGGGTERIEGSSSRRLCESVRSHF